MIKKRLHLVPGLAIEEASKAFEDGVRKYGSSYSWRTLETEITVTTAVDAIMRHLVCIMKGEDLADDSGVSHWGHIIARASIAEDCRQLGLLKDDRILVRGIINGKR